jgi:sulfoacetaldehyde dehydrogenase
MRQCDLVVATGSQANVRAAYTCGTPAFGVGAGNVASIIDETADCRGGGAEDRTLQDLRQRHQLLVGEQRRDGRRGVRRALAALDAQGGVRVDEADKPRLQPTMWPRRQAFADGDRPVGPLIAQRAGLKDLAAAQPAMLLVEEDAESIGPAHPFSGEKLSPVLTVYRARDFATMPHRRGDLRHQGAGHSVSLHTTQTARALELGLKRCRCRA